MKKEYPSFIQLSKDVFELLSSKQRIGAFKNIASSVIQALLEVISLTAAIPVFVFLINPVQGLQSPHSGYFKMLEPLPWQELVTILILTFFLKNLFSLWLVSLQSKFIHNISVSFSKKLYQHFFSQTWKDYVKENSAESVRKIKETAFNFSTYILQGYFQLITDTLICVLMIIGMIWYDYRIILAIGVLSLPVLFLYKRFQKNTVSKINHSFRHLAPEATIVLAQGVDSFAEARIYAKEDFFIEKFIALRKETSQHLANLTTASAAPSRIFEVVGILCFAGIVVFSKVQTTKPGDFVTLLGLLTIVLYRIIPSLNRIFTSLSQVQTYSYAVSELKGSFHFSDEKEKTKSSPLHFNHFIKFQNFGYRYNSTYQNFLFDNVSITINKGDFVLIEGPSGTGKTTFIHLVAGLMDDYDGEIFIDDTTLNTSTRIEWQKKIGIVAQTPVVLQDTLLANVTFAEDQYNVNMKDADHALQLACLHEFMLALPLRWKTPIGENGITLSGGQRQRLILARALFRNPEVLLLDEVTNQLDEENKINILRNLKALTNSGKTIIMASHDPVVQKFATRRFFFSQNSIHEV